MGRGSFWERMERLAAEKEAARKEREAKRAAGKGMRSRAGDAGSPRVKVVWSVRDSMGDVVRTFAYSAHDEAVAEAKRLTEESGRTHYVQRDKVPVDG